ncbi:MAG TPA: HAD family phosphatase [Solirubrobacteraceae bacterium]|jgi:HAD superfamily hydrolase (TIGR01509 family)|nr:HAD family phosphatase [Solirubrobacteraceae bacterium]
MLVIFDCDGVLVDSEPTSNRVMTAAINDIGLAMSVDEVANSFQAKLLSEIVAELEARRGGKPLPDGWLAAFERDRADAFREQLEPIDGIREVLQTLSEQGVARCVATQASIAKTELTLGLTGLRRFFGADALFSARMVERGKPHPDVFLLAASAMGAAPERCVVVEDAVAGVLGARAAGMAVLGFAPREAAAASLRAAGAEVFASMERLPALLDAYAEG